ncbi:MAG: glycine/D-amino acid oxidase-like deaminating enzyme [Paracoccaceae bacterium]|jgi:glycine/D-amino acid oxidase-like deaminating enzyme
MPALHRIHWTGGAPAYMPKAAALPADVDVVVVGAGFTGLTAAIHLARGGRSVAVLDAGSIGHGASSRNGGMVGPSFHKIGMAGLTAKYGEAKAVAILREGMLALDHFESFVADEGLDCDLQLTGRFRGAVTSDDYDATARECARLEKAVGLPFTMIPQSDQRDRIGTDFYRGGVVYHRDGGIHPRKLVAALAAKAEDAGATLHPDTLVTGITASGRGAVVRHAGGVINARDVIVATNGYGIGAGADPLRLRVVPIRTGAVATGQLSATQMADLTPANHMFSESRRVFMWFRPTPDRTRFIFGGRMGPIGGGPQAQADALRASALRVFPQLEGVAFEEVWSGYVAYTVDHAPHLGKIDGVWFAGGYCGSGVTRSIYFASKLARRVLGQPGDETAFDDLPFPKAPIHPVVAGLGAQALTRWHAMRDAQALAARDR